ncbi:hypothetical protein ABZ769_33830 [Streptomyces olivoreticuli]
MLVLDGHRLDAGESVGEGRAERLASGEPCGLKNLRRSLRFGEDAVLGGDAE